MPKKKNDKTVFMGDYMISEKEFARSINHSHETVRKMRSRGYVDKNCKTKMPPYYRIGRSVQYKSSDVNEWIEQFRHE